MSIHENIIKLLNEAFKPEILQVENDSAKHAGHAGSPGTGESHFSIYIVSSAFEGVKPVERHRMVYEVLKPVFEQGLHSLKITTLTPESLLKE